MKYIRTKKGRIIDIEMLKKRFSCIYEDTETIFWESACKYPERHKQEIKSRTLKTADTIEELCDEFVIWYKEKHHIVFDKNNLLKNVHDIQLMLFGGAIIYGAIWTDKGLIYVAKMNDKGELELL